jgi:hypothetical protein
MRPQWRSGAGQHFRHVGVIDSNIMRIRTLLATLALLLAVAAQAQSVYATDLSDASASVAALLAKADKVTGKQSPTKLGLVTDTIELQMRLSALSAQVTRAGVTGVGGDRNDPNLLLIASAADSLLLANRFVQHFLDTRDRTYLRQAVAAHQIAKSFRAAVR